MHFWASKSIWLESGGNRKKKVAYVLHFWASKSIWLESGDNRISVFAYLTTLLGGHFPIFAYLTTLLRCYFFISYKIPLKIEWHLYREVPKFAKYAMASLSPRTLVFELKIQTVRKHYCLTLNSALKVDFCNTLQHFSSKVAKSVGR